MDCMSNRKNLTIIYGDATLGVRGKGFSYIFSYSAGGPQSFCINGKEWLYRVPKPTFWRATTDNDRGNKFSDRSGTWMSADVFLPCTLIEVFIDDKKIDFHAPTNNQLQSQSVAEKIKIQYTYETITVPSAKVLVSYLVSADTYILVSVHYHGNQELPELPVFGMRFISPTKAISYRYEGLSGETYPDRMAGGIPGIYEVDGLPLTKYLVPQDCNVHMDTKWLEIVRNTTLHSSRKDNTPFSIKFSSIDSNFAFSCIPYTAEELENATHHEELPPARRTVISILGAVRGVGGIDSWGSDVEKEYRINAGKDIKFSFLISP